MIMLPIHRLFLIEYALPVPRLGSNTFAVENLIATRSCIS